MLLLQDSGMPEPFLAEQRSSAFPPTEAEPLKAYNPPWRGSALLIITYIVSE